MSKYTFTFKKGDIFVEFSTTDREVVEKQFQIWVNSASEYAKKHPKTKAVKPEMPASAPVSAPQPEIKKETEKEIMQEEKEEIFDKASSLLKTINDIQKESEIISEEEPKNEANFDEILEQTVENPTFEPQVSNDRVYLNLINSKGTTDKFHYLMITAYYLSEFEKLERFSLKQINSKLMQNLSTVIDHTMLQEAINQNFLELVPDLTGTSEVAEYRLTRAGEEFFSKRI